MNPSIKDSIYQLLLNSLPEYRAIQIRIEDLRKVTFGRQSMSLHSLNKGCYLCPRKDEEGSLHLCMDGCFSIPRRAKAGVVHKIPKLKGLIRERLVFDTFVTREESLNCKTANAQVPSTTVFNDIVN